MRFASTVGCSRHLHETSAARRQVRTGSSNRPEHAIGTCVYSSPLEGSAVATKKKHAGTRGLEKETRRWREERVGRGTRQGGGKTKGQGEKVAGDRRNGSSVNSSEENE